MNIKVLKHERTRSGYFIKHKALVEMTDIDIKNDKEEIINTISIKVNYHPNGYGVYGGKISKSARDNQYIVVWETGATA